MCLHRDSPPPSDQSRDAALPQDTDDVPEEEKEQEATSTARVHGHSRAHGTVTHRVLVALTQVHADVCVVRSKSRRRVQAGKRGSCGLGRASFCFGPESLALRW